MVHGIPYSIFMGRIPEDDEPTWLPEDRDLVGVWSEFEKDKLPCGHWEWQHPDLETAADRMFLDYDVCPIQREQGRKIEEVHEERDDMHGVFVAYYPTPREEAVNGS